MELVTVEINETNYLCDRLKEKVGAYYGVYLIDKSEVTHCCELEPSYWLEAVGYRTDKPLDEGTEEDLMGSWQDSSHYRHCRAVDRLPCTPFASVYPRGIEFDDFEEAVNHAQSLAW